MESPLSVDIQHCYCLFQKERVKEVGALMPMTHFHSILFHIAGVDEGSSRRTNKSWKGLFCSSFRSWLCMYYRHTGPAQMLLTGLLLHILPGALRIKEQCALLQWPPSQGLTTK